MIAIDYDLRVVVVVVDYVWGVGTWGGSRWRTGTGMMEHVEVATQLGGLWRLILRRPLVVLVVIVAVDVVIGGGCVL